MNLFLVEDEPRIRQMLQSGLDPKRVKVEICSSAEQALEKVKTSPYAIDVFLVDAVLPGLGGLEFCRQLRQLGKKEPVIILTAGEPSTARTSALQAGATDVLANPPDLAVLKAKLDNWVLPSRDTQRNPLTIGDLVVDVGNRRVTKLGQELLFSRKEYQLLEYLALNAGHIVTRAMIASSVWNTVTNQYTNVIDVFINHLRKKLDAAGGPRVLHTVRGKGFRLGVEGDFLPLPSDSV